jgi:hypothetical protein
MFGLFESKSEKLTKNCLKIARELSACNKRVLNNPDSDWWKNYLHQTELNLKEKYLEVQKLMGDDYLSNLIGLIDEEYFKSKYVLSDKEQKKVNDLMTDYKIKKGISLAL